MAVQVNATDPSVLYAVARSAAAWANRCALPLALLSLALFAGCSKSKEDLVQDCVKAHIKAHQEKVAHADRTGADFLDRYSKGIDRLPAEVEAEAHRTCLRAAAGK